MWVIYLHILRKSNYIKQYSILKQRNTRKSAYKIQQYNNFVIDEYVKSVDDNNPQKPNQSQLWSDITALTKPTVYANYQRIINSKYTSNDAIDKMLVRNKANQDVNRIVSAEIERVNKNLDFVEKVLGTYEVPLKEYNRLLSEQSNRSVANRRQVIEDVLTAKNEFLVSEGLNIPDMYSYRDLDIMAEQLLKESRALSDFEEADAINQQARSEGKDDVYTMKKWEWTGIGKTTRHYDMQNQDPIDFYLTFTVEDENTGTIDEMMYPLDLNGSPENVMGCNCKCIYY